MKIVDVCAFYSEQGGGVRTYIDQKLRAAEKFKQYVDVIVPAASNARRQVNDYGRIIQIKAPTLIVDKRYYWFDDEAAVHALLDDIQPDLIEASSPWKTANIVANWQGNASGKPVKRAMYMHADPMSAYAYRWFGKVFQRPTIDKQFDWFWRHLRRMNKQYDSFVCPNQNLCERLVEGGVSKAKTISMGVEGDVFGPKYQDETVRQDMLAACDLGPDAALFVGVGRFSSEKRWPMVIDAISNASKQKAIGLAIIGGGRQERKLVSHVGHNPHIKIISHVSERKTLAALLASADGLVHGCEAETFGLVAAEAKAAGAPMILPNSGGAADFYDPARGEIYKGGSRSSLEKAVLRFLERDQESLRSAAHAASREVRTLNDHFQDLFSHYKTLLEYELAPAE